MSMSVPTDNQEFKSQQDSDKKEQSFFGIIIHSFFVVPFLIAVSCVILFTAIKLLTHEEKTVYDFLEDIKTGGLTKRWQAAFELSKILANPQSTPQEDRFERELIFAFKQSLHDDPRVRQYLALAMGRTARASFFDTLIENIDREKEENLYAIIYALGMLRDKRAVKILTRFIDNPVARIRSVIVVSLGNIGDLESKEILKKTLSDPEPNVQWGSALSLAKMGDGRGREVVAQLLNRDYLARFKEVDQEEQNYLILTAMEAVSYIGDPELYSILDKLSKTDPNMRIRSKALEVLNQAKDQNF